MRFQIDEQRKHVQHVEQLCCVLGQPVVGLNVPELRRRPPIADNRPLAVLLTIAEPLGQDQFAGNFVPPNGGRNVVAVARPSRGNARVRVSNCGLPRRKRASSMVDASNTSRFASAAVVAKRFTKRVILDRFGIADNTLRAW